MICFDFKGALLSIAVSFECFTLHQLIGMKSFRFLFSFTYLSVKLKRHRQLMGDENNSIVTC